MDNLLRFKEDFTCCFIDYETKALGLHENVNLPWEVACIKTKGRQILEEYHALIKWNPILKISEAAARVTGYSEEKVIKYGQDPLTVANKIEKYLTECDYVVGHNVINFDIYLNNAFFRKVGKKPYNFIPKLIDTNCLLRGIELGEKFNPNKESLVEYQYRMNSIVKKGLFTNLSFACEKYKISFIEEKRHQALYDLQVNFDVFNKIIWEQEI